MSNLHKNTNKKQDKAEGTLIAAIGLPGSGKSSVTRELGKLLNMQTFHEPEESEWADAVKNRDISGRFAAMTWFRAIRLPPLYKAHQMRKDGEMVMVDSYYDKLFGFCLGKEGMEWLMEKTDTYFNVMQEVADLDFKNLPNADYIVSFELEYETWLKFLKLRGRNLDKDEQFLKSYQTQQYFIDAAHHYAKTFNCRVISFQQEFSSLEDSANKLKERLIAEGVV